MAELLHSVSSPRRRRRNRLAAALAAALLLSTSGGCSIFAGLQNSLDYSDECNEWMLGYRNSAWAAKAWHRQKPCYQNRQHLDDFGAGFRAGYLDVANGGRGCTPAFAPREYWGWKYQSPVGQQRIAAWFAGFPMGAKAAEEEGLGNYALLMPSSMVQHEYAQAGWTPPGAPFCCPLGPAMPVTGGAAPIPGDGAMGSGVLGEPTPAGSPSDMMPMAPYSAPAPMPVPAPIID